ncbi:MAG: putative heavy metal-binding protein [Oscillospiraceae bacterium]|nr:putative heavy metal-binding protein [Oscillospiraceae bacterium]
MIITTTPSVEGKRIVNYFGIVFGEVITGVNVIKDFAAGLSNFFGGRSATYEEELMNARHQALAEMEQRAYQLGANAVVGVDIDYEVLGADNGMLMVTASGTAVFVD